MSARVYGTGRDSADTAVMNAHGLVEEAYQAVLDLHGVSEPEEGQGEHFARYAKQAIAALRCALDQLTEQTEKKAPAKLAPIPREEAHQALVLRMEAEGASKLDIVRELLLGALEDPDPDSPEMLEKAAKKAKRAKKTKTKKAEAK